jgi:hypothetical protein
VPLKLQIDAILVILRRISRGSRARLQTQEFRIFERTDLPFIRKQYVGDFIKSDITGRYDFIYDYYGAFFYAGSSMDYFAMSAGMNAVMRKTLPLLSEEGVFYAEYLPVFDQEDLPWGGYPGYIICFDPLEEKFLLVTRERSAFARGLREFLPSNEIRRGIFAVENFMTWCRILESATEARLRSANVLSGQTSARKADVFAGTLDSESLARDISAACARCIVCEAVSEGSGSDSTSVSPFTGGSTG